jgi:hypothetical protein
MVMHVCTVMRRSRPYLRAQDRDQNGLKREKEVSLAAAKLKSSRSNIRTRRDGKPTSHDWLAYPPDSTQVMLASFVFASG